MTTPSGAPRPGSWLAPAPASGDPEARAEQGPADPHATASPDDATGHDDLAAHLAQLPVTDHADVLEAEHDRLHRLLATIDQL